MSVRTLFMIEEYETGVDGDVVSLRAINATTGVEVTTGNWPVAAFDDFANNLYPTADEAALVAIGYDNAFADHVLKKWDLQGNLLASYTVYAGGGNDDVFGLVPLNDGNIVGIVETGANSEVWRWDSDLNLDNTGNYPIDLGRNYNSLNINRTPTGFVIHDGSQIAAIGGFNEIAHYLNDGTLDWTHDPASADNPDFVEAIGTSWIYFVHYTDGTIHRLDPSTGVEDTAGGWPGANPPDTAYSEFRHRDDTTVLIVDDFSSTYISGFAIFIAKLDPADPDNWLWVSDQKFGSGSRIWGLAIDESGDAYMANTNFGTPADNVIVKVSGVDGSTVWTLALPDGADGGPPTLENGGMWVLDVPDGVPDPDVPNDGLLRGPITPRLRSNASKRVNSLYEAVRVVPTEDAINEVLPPGDPLVKTTLRPYVLMLRPLDPSAYYYPRPRRTRDLSRSYGGETIKTLLRRNYPARIMSLVPDIPELAAVMDANETVTLTQLTQYLFDRWGSEFVWFSGNPVPDLRWDVLGTSSGDYDPDVDSLYAKLTSSSLKPDALGLAGGGGDPNGPTLYDLARNVGPYAMMCCAVYRATGDTRFLEVVRSWYDAAKPHLIDRYSSGYREWQDGPNRTMDGLMTHAALWIWVEAIGSGDADYSFWNTYLTVDYANTHGDPAPNHNLSHPTLARAIVLHYQGEAALAAGEVTDWLGATATTSVTGASGNRTARVWNHNVVTGLGAQRNYYARYTAQYAFELERLGLVTDAVLTEVAAAVSHYLIADPDGPLDLEPTIIGDDNPVTGLSLPSPVPARGDASDWDVWPGYTMLEARDELGIIGRANAYANAQNYDSAAALGGLLLAGSPTTAPTGGVGELRVGVVTIPQTPDQMLSVRDVLEQIGSVTPFVLDTDRDGRIEIRALYGPDADTTPHVTLAREDVEYPGSSAETDPFNRINRATRRNPNPYSRAEQQEAMNLSWFQVASRQNFGNATALFTAPGGRDDLTGADLSALEPTDGFENNQPSAWASDSSVVAAGDYISFVDASLVPVITATFRDQAGADSAGTVTIVGDLYFDGAWYDIARITLAHCGETAGITLLMRWDAATQAIDISVRSAPEYALETCSFFAFLGLDKQWTVEVYLNTSTDAWTRSSVSKSATFGLLENGDTVPSVDGGNAIEESQTTFGVNESDVTIELFELDTADLMAIAEAFVTANLTPRKVRELTLVPSRADGYAVDLDDVGRLAQDDTNSSEQGPILAVSYSDDEGVAGSSPTMEMRVELEVPDTTAAGAVDTTTTFLLNDDGSFMTADDGSLLEAN